MPFLMTSDQDVYCFLKAELEPTYRVLAQPQSGYFSQWLFCYRILHGDDFVAELSGDFRDVSEGSLMLQAREIVERLPTEKKTAQVAARSSLQLPFASRLPPKRSDCTWFSSGRAAFAWLLEDVVRPQRIFLPTFVCWSLVDVVLSKFPDVELSFYAVDRQLQSEFPPSLQETDALVFIHYFGHVAARPHPEVSCCVLEDASHLMLSNAERLPTSQGEFRFGSLRKTYRVADGGFVSGAFLPQYESSRNLDAWLRLRGTGWADLREAENMTDRSWSVSDISSQSLAVALTTDEERVIRQRHLNHDFLDRHFGVGESPIRFRAAECPLLHYRTFSSQAERDSLRTFLASRQLFTSIHWPMHSYLRNRSDQFDISDALWLENHSLAVPISEDFKIADMEYVCDAVHEWNRAGAADFACRAAG